MLGRIDSKSQKRTQLWPIAILRVYTGVYFAWHGFGHIRNANFPKNKSGFPKARIDDRLSDRMPFLR